VFAAAVVLWETLAAEPLFKADDEGSVVGKILHGEASAPSSLRADHDGALDAVVLKGLEKDPAKRYASAQDMAAAIEAVVAPATPSTVAVWVRSLCVVELLKRKALVAEVEKAVAPAEGPAAAASTEAVRPPSAATSVVPAARGVAPPPNRRRRVLVGAVVLVGVGAIAGGVTVWRARATTSRSQPLAVLPSASAMEPGTSPSLSSSAPSVPASIVAANPSMSPDAAVAPLSQAAPPAATTHRPPAAQKVDCSNPYEYDAQGRRRYRRECLR
jgi:serine/threonine-protein kinase